MSIHLVKLISMILCTFLLVGFAAGEVNTQPMYAPVRARLGVFSWQEENATDEKALDEMLKILVQVNASEVYQYIHFGAFQILSTQNRVYSY